MAQPISGVILYNAKINHNGLFNCDFGGSGATRDSVMGGTSNIATYKFSYSNCTYMRKDKVITVDENADVLDNAGVNYCRYMNPQFSNTRYIYAFIDEIEYVAPSTSRLHIRTDVFMTWFDKIDWGQQYVERFNWNIEFNTHYSAGNPTIGSRYITDFLSDNAYTAPICFYSSPMPVGFDFEAYDETNDNGWIVINITKDAFATNNEPNMSSITPEVSGLPQGSFWIAVQPTDLWLFTNIINGPQDMPSRGGFTLADVLQIYYVPRGCLSVDTDNPRFVVEQGAGANCPYFKFDISGPFKGGGGRWTLPGAANTMSNGYTPKNKVLLRYPYNFYKITDKSGHEWIFKPEQFSSSSIDGDNLNVDYKKYLSLSDNVSLGLKINNYMNADNTESICVFQNFPQVAAMSDSYQQYLALNKNSLQNQYRWMSYDLGMGIASSSIKAGMGAATENPGAIASGAKDLFGSLINYERQSDALNAKMSDMKHMPSTVACSGNGNLALMMDTAGLFIERWCIDRAAAEKIDQTWDMWGYPIEEQLPYKPWVHKSRYGYVKTKNCHITGEIPEDDRAELDKLFNAGMTVWRNAATYGIYSFSDNDNVEY